MKKTALFLMIILPMVTFGQHEKDNSMAHILKNKNLEIHIDLPLKNYNLSRFDWTGKITAVKYKGIDVSTVERIDDVDDNNYGKGFYNEFGIETPIGFEEIKEGEWFPKIGVGALKKEGEEYSFSKTYEIAPADFKLVTDKNKLIIECKSQYVNGYSYVLKKEIELMGNSFVIKYHLSNKGDKIISTNEYCHNFLAINKELIGSQYILKFPFDIIPELFGATVNPEGMVVIGQNEITFKNTPNEQFFFSNLSGGESDTASWELINTKSKIGISETGSFTTNKVNLWGWKHVISPELFYEVKLKPGEKTEWSRTYHLFDIE
jgi:hypothetical protein